MLFEDIAEARCKQGPSYLVSCPSAPRPSSVLESAGPSTLARGALARRRCASVPVPGAVRKNVPCLTGCTCGAAPDVRVSGALHGWAAAHGGLLDGVCGRALVAAFRLRPCAAIVRPAAGCALALHGTFGNCSGCRCWHGPPLQARRVQPGGRTQGRGASCC